MFSCAPSTSFQTSFILIFIRGISFQTSEILTCIFVPTAGGWFHVVFTYNNVTGAFKTYINGVNDQDTTANFNSVTKQLVVGNRSVGNPDNFWNGQIDEIRLSNTDISANWISTEYANQSSPSTFYSVGEEESLAVGTNI